MLLVFVHGWCGMTKVEKPMEKGEMIARGRSAEVFAWGDDQVLKLYEH